MLLSKGGLDFGVQFMILSFIFLYYARLPGVLEASLLLAFTFLLIMPLYRAIQDCQAETFASSSFDSG